MKNKTLVLFGVITYILQVLSSAEDMQGAYIAPIILIAVSAITTIVFTAMAVIRLWKTQRVTAILLLVSSVIVLFYVSNPIKIVHTLIFIWTLSLLWAMAKYEKHTDLDTPV